MRPRVRPACRPDQRLDEFALTVAGDARDADDLAAAHGEIGAIDRAACRRSRRSVRPIASRQRRAGRAGPLSTLRLTLRPVIARTISRALVVGGRAGCATVRPSRRIVTRSVIAVASLSLWVTKRTVRPSAARRREHIEQRVALGRRQHRGRLVEDEDARVAIERLQDLDALAHADRQAADRARRGRRRGGGARRARRPRRAPRLRSMNGPRRGSAP